MSNVEDVIARTVAAVEDQFEMTQRSRLPRIRERVIRKARRRRLAKGTNGLVVGVGSVIILSTVPISLPFTSSPSSQPRAIAPGSSSGGPTEGLGFWPYATEERSADLCESMLDNHHAVAAQFVGDVFGWSNTAERNIQHINQDRIAKEQGNLSRTFTGGPLPDDPWITLELSRIGDGGCWWVTGVSDAENGAQFSVAVRDGTLGATWEMPEGAERADLVVVDTDSSARKVVTGDPGATSASVDDFTGPGFAIVRWKSDDGTVFSAAGVTLPTGDYSATSP